MSQTPVAFMALLFALVAFWEWRRSPLPAHLSLGVAAVFALAAFEYPGQSVQFVVEDSGHWLGWVVNAARGVGLAVVMITLVGQARAGLGQRD